MERNQSKLKKKSILIVDDTESIRLLITSLLEKEYDIIGKANGHDALQYLIDNNIPDLILLDMEMPEMNGRVFLRRIRYGGTKFNKIPIIFITTINGKIMIKSMMKLQIAGYIIKPFTSDELIERVNAVLQNNII